MRTLALCASATVLLSGCLRAPQIHPRALENNEYCAQYLVAGNLNQAEIHCDLGLDFSPEYADLWSNKGLIAFRRNQMDAAKEAFIKAIRYNQEHAYAYNGLGVIYFQEKKYGQAHDQFQRALKVNPDYLEARYNLALALNRLDKKAEARKEYRTLLAINPQLASAHHDLGVMAANERLWDEAVAELGKAVELDPRFVEAWMALGAAYTEVGKYAEAKEAYVSCLALDPDNIPCRNNAAIVARKAGLLENTLKESQELQQVEQTAPAMYQLALQYREKGLKAEEERTFKKCLKFDARYAMCHYGLHLLFKEEQKDKEATVACRNFLKFAALDEFPAEIENCERYVSASSY
jgi:tetratricopeptide (TPR) repeat protein